MSDSNTYYYTPPSRVGYSAGKSTLWVLVFIVSAAIKFCCYCALRSRRQHNQHPLPVHSRPQPPFTGAIPLPPPPGCTRVVRPSGPPEPPGLTPQPAHNDILILNPGGLEAPNPAPAPSLAPPPTYTEATRGKPTAPPAPRPKPGGDHSDLNAKSLLD